MPRRKANVCKDTCFTMNMCEYRWEKNSGNCPCKECLINMTCDLSCEDFRIFKHVMDDQYKEIIRRRHPKVAKLYTYIGKKDNDPIEDYSNKFDPCLPAVTINHSDSNEPLF